MIETYVLVFTLYNRFHDKYANMIGSMILSLPTGIQSNASFRWLHLR
jgi:hypothetical protein